MKRLIIAIALPIAGCGAPAIQNSAAPASDKASGEVLAVEGRLLAAYKAKDAAKVATFYASDAELTGPFKAPLSGADQQKASAAGFADPAFAFDFVNARTEVSPGGEMAYTRGSYTVRYTHPGTGEAATQRGHYLTVFRKTAEGEWKIVQDMATPGPDATR